jgi:hypothetical protein
MIVVEKMLEGVTHLPSYYLMELETLFEKLTK